MTNAVTLGRHLEVVRPLVLGTAVFGDEASLEIIYDGDKLDRATAVSRDIDVLKKAGYRARCIGRNRAVAIDLTNVGTAFNARFVS